MKFKVGDKVITEDGASGIVMGCFNDNSGENEIYDIKIGNKNQEWYAEGLRLAEEKKEQVELLPCKKCNEKPNINDRGSLWHVFFTCACETKVFIAGDIDSSIKLWNEEFGKKKRELKKGDVVYVKAIVTNPEADEDSDIICSVGWTGFSAQENFETDDDMYCNSAEVYTLEELKEMK